MEEDKKYYNDEWNQEDLNRMIEEVFEEQKNKVNPDREMKLYAFGDQAMEMFNNAMKEEVKKKFDSTNNKPDGRRYKK